jgi:probable O-glycosylation ligase (exosortase A-associated)
MSVPAIIATYSRGGFLTMAAVLFLLLTRSSKKLLLVVPLAIGVLVVLPLLPEKYFNRIESIEGASQKDGSAIERLNAWRFNFNLAMARPLTGGGFEPIRADVWEQYAPEFKHHPISAHSIYFQVLGDHGFLALGVYLLIFGMAILSCRTIQTRARKIPSCSWLSDYARMMEISLFAFLIAGTFYNRAYVDIAFHLICTVIILKVLARTEFAKAGVAHQTLILEQSSWGQAQTAFSARTP